MRVYRKAMLAALATVAIIAMSTMGIGAAAAKPITLRFVSLAWQEQAVESVKNIVDRWNKANPSVQVQYIPLDWGSVHDYMITSFQAKDVPDVFHYESGPVMEFGAKGYLTDLSGLMTAELKKDILPDAWKTVTDKNGAVYGVPFLWESMVTLYNKDMFAEAGVKAPAASDKPWDWDDMRKAAKALTRDRNGDGKIDQWGAAFGLRNPANRILNLSLGFGGEYFYSEGGKPVVKVGGKEKELLRVLLDMMYVDKTATTDGIGLSGPELFPGFFAGKYAMLPGIGVWTRQQAVEGAPKGFNWGVIGPLKATTQAQGSTTQTVSIPAAAKHKQEAMQFTEFLLNQENMAKLALGDWLIPTRQSALGRPEFNTSAGGWDVAKESMNHLTFATWQDVAGFSELKSKVANPLFSTLFSGKISIDEFARRMEDEGNQILRRYY